MLNLRSRVGLGTAPLGSLADGPLWWGPQDRDEAVATIRAALDAGIDWVDTAPFYGWGRAEELVGDAVHGRRDDVTILTKCGTVRQSDGTWHEDGLPDAVRADLEGSLRRLRTDHVDALQLHDPDPAVPVEETVGAMAELVNEGKVRAIGLSNHPAELLVRGAAVCADRRRAAPVVDPPARRGRRGREGLVPDTGAEFLAWSPLASGFLVDAFDPDQTADGDLRRRLPWVSGEGAVRLAQVRRDAEAAGRSLQDVAMSWVLDRARAIVGARTPNEARGHRRVRVGGLGVGRRQRSTAAAHRSILVNPEVDPVQW